MSFSSVKDIPEGSMITFRSKNAADGTYWKGTLEAFGTYNFITNFGNPKPYNEAVRQSDPTVPSDLTLLTYFLITVDNDSSLPTKQIFADEWISAGTLNEVSLGNQVTLLVDDPNSNTQAILSLLAGAGYKTRVLSS